MDSVALLVAHGHSEHGVWDYSLEKFNMYVKAAQRREAGSRIVEIVDLSVTIAGAFGGKQIKEHLNDLQEEL